MILNKYFLEEKRFAINTTIHQTTHQHITANTHPGTLRTWWVCPGITSVSVSKCSMSDVRCRRIRNVADCQNIIDSFLTAMMISSHRIDAALLGFNLKVRCAVSRGLAALRQSFWAFGSQNGWNNTFLFIEDRDIQRLVH